MALWVWQSDPAHKKTSEKPNDCSLLKFLHFIDFSTRLSSSGFQQLLGLKVFQVLLIRAVVLSSGSLPLLRGPQLLPRVFIKCSKFFIYIQLLNYNNFVILKNLRYLLQFYKKVVLPELKKIGQHWNLCFLSFVPI